MEQGTQKVVDSEFFPRGREGAGRPAPDHRAGQPRRLRRLRPGAVRGPQGRPLDVRDDARRRRRVRDRGHRPRRHVRRPVPHARRSSAATCSASSRRPQLHSFGERVSPYSFWWGSAPGVFGGLGPRRAQPALDPLAARPGRRRLQRLVHVPDPARRCWPTSGSRCRSSSSGTTPSTACAPSRPATRP